VGDFDTKVHRAIEFLEDGDRIKVTVRFRGRELTHPELGRNLIARFVDRVKDHGVAERTPLLEGKSMHITMASLHKPKVHEAGHPRDAASPDGESEAPAATTEPTAEAQTTEQPATEQAATEQPAPAPAPSPEPATTPAPAATKAPAAPAKTAAAPKKSTESTPAPEPVTSGE
jgi:translation initiation factor IF-3